MMAAFFYQQIFCVMGLNAGWLWTNLKAISRHRWCLISCTIEQQETAYSAIVKTNYIQPHIRSHTWSFNVWLFFDWVVWLCFTSVFLLGSKCWFKLCMMPKSRLCFWKQAVMVNIFCLTPVIYLRSWYSYSHRIKWLFHEVYA